MPEPLVLSLIIPAYNEAGRIGQSLERICDYLGQQDFPSEVIVVDDGSTDETAGFVQRHIRHQAGKPVRLRLISNPKNMGKGFSVRAGVLQASGSIVVFSDADLSTPITELPKLLDPIRGATHDVVIGSRAINRGLIGRRQSLWREYAGRIFNLLMRAIVGLNLKDTQCGFKAYRRELIVPIFQRQQVYGFSFDVEILYLASRQGLRIMEVPVIWNHVEGSRVHMIRDSLNMFLELLRIRLNGWLGRYAESARIPAPPNVPSMASGHDQANARQRQAP